MLHDPSMSKLYGCELDLEGWARQATSAHVQDALDAIRSLKVLVPLWEEHVVRTARLQRMWWMDIAWALGVSEQAVHQRWKTAIEAPPRVEQPGGLCKMRLGCASFGEEHRWRTSRRRGRT
jgi:hypothetical protein